MIKRIFWSGFTFAAAMVGLTCLIHDSAMAASTYKLEYPAGYGCRCVPNWQNYGYNKTTWHAWPGEERLDINHPKAIGAEPLPRTKGIEQLPLPRVKLQDLNRENAPPDAGNTTPGGNYLPENTPLPGGTTPPGGGDLPGSQPQPGGFNPPPGLPSEPGGFNLPPNLPPSDVILPQDTPAPLNNRENAPLPPGRDSKDNSKPDAGAMQFKPESPRRGVSNQSAPNRNAGTGGMKTSMTRLPSTEPTAPAAEVAPLMNRSNPQANWDSALQQGVYAEASRAGSPYSPSEVAKQTNYQTPVAPNGNGRFSGEIVEQSYQQPHPEPQTSSAMPADSRPTVAPPVAMKGYCPVELNRGGRWVQGDPRWTVVYQGATYHLSGNEQRLLFLANPDQFAPANGGNDMVVTVNDHRTVPGDLSYCAAFKGRIYMFSSAATQMEFQKNPERFIGK